MHKQPAKQGQLFLERDNHPGTVALRAKLKEFTTANFAVLDGSKGEVLHKAPWLTRSRTFRIAAWQR